MKETSRTCYFGMDLMLMMELMLSTNQIGVFFNLQYFLTRLICDFDFLVADRHQ